MVMTAVSILDTFAESSFGEAVHFSAIGAENLDSSVYVAKQSTVPPCLVTSSQQQEELAVEVKEALA